MKRMVSMNDFKRLIITTILLSFTIFIVGIYVFDWVCRNV